MNVAVPLPVSAPVPTISGPAVGRRRSRSILRLVLFFGLGIAVSPFVFLAVIAVYVLSCLHLDSTTDALRSVAVHHSGGGWESVARGTVGWLPIAIARTAMPFVKEAPPEALVALQSIKGAQFAVCKRSKASGPAEFGVLLAEADRVMKGDRWEKVVGVIDHDACVGVYVPSKGLAEDRVRTTFFVVSGNDLVVGSADADLRPLIELASMKLREGGGEPLRGLFQSRSDDPTRRP
jgi:hypothetical protein